MIYLDNDVWFILYRGRREFSPTSQLFTAKDFSSECVVMSKISKSFYVMGSALKVHSKSKIKNVEF